MCITLRGRWCNMIVLSVHASTKDKTDHMKDSFYDELDLVIDKFLKHHMSLGDFSDKVNIEGIVTCCPSNVTNNC
jgi:hypothetical protein